LELRAGQDRAVLDPEAGGRLASLVAGGAERLVTDPGAGPEPPELTGLAWGSFLMAPWVGRLDGGRLPWDGRVHQLPTTFRGHAIHGTTFDRPWEVEASDDTSATLSIALTDPWPFGGLVRQRFTLRPGELVLEAEIEAGEVPMPVSLGWHPWFARPAEGDVRMRVDATGTLHLRDDLVPTGAVVPLEPATTDLRHGPALGERRLDDVYVEVGQPAELRWPDLVLRMTWDGAVQSVVVHTPPRGVTLEPQTAWPNAPLLVAQDLGQPEPRRHPAGAATTLDRSVVGLVVAAPGTPLRASTTWTWQELDGGSAH